MICRKHVWGSWWIPLLVAAGLGCAQLPLQAPRELSVEQANGAATQGHAERRSAPTPPKESASSSNSSQSIVQASAAEPTPNGPPGKPLGPVPAPAAGGSTSLTATATPQPSGVEDPSAKLHTLYREAAERYAQVDSYIVRLVRREQLNGKDKPEEILLFKFRKEPWSVYLKWLGSEGKGREVVYVQGRYDNKIHTLLAAGDIPLMPAGKRFAVDPDNPFVVSSSRHSIRQAGIGALIEGFGKRLEESTKGSQGGGGEFKYLGSIQRPDLAGPGEAVEQTIAAGIDPQLPRGGHRLWVFDPLTKFPVLIVTHDDTGHEVEYYCYDRFEFPVRLDDDDFNPDRLWKPKREAAQKK
jgi:hypothetical protein